MKRQIAIFFLLVHLSVNTEAGQLLRMPSLMHHYHKHQQNQARLTLGQFLLMHYAGDDGKDADHDQLPFHDFFHSSTAMVYAPMIDFASASCIILSPQCVQWQESSEKLFFTYRDCILQPPRHNS